MKTKFPKEFIWGAATSAYQIEGAWQENRKGRSIWDDFTHRGGTIHNGENGDIACDHFHRYKEDVALMKDLGIQSYRFSINWPRVLPEGKGYVNEAGLDFYDRLVDELLNAGIDPCVTLYHWELPLALHQKGGWLNPDTAAAFSELATTVSERLHDRVKRYVTLNEPQCSVQLGYGAGIHAPGCRTDTLTQMAAAHNLLLAHGQAVQALRAEDSCSEIGIASTGNICYPLEKSCGNRKSAYDATFRTNERWGFSHHWYLDPVVLGHYPDDDLSEEAKRFVGDVLSEELRTISQPLDFLAVNLYNGDPVDVQGKVVDRPIGSARTALRWSVSPEAMHYGLAFLHQRYDLPLYVTENGQSCNDRIYLDGKVHDPDRIDYMHRYLIAMHDAMQEGVPVKGYYHWSLMDNFEWHSGYDDRFGLIYVDYEHDLRRLPKDSYYWYQQLIRTRKLPLV